MNMLQPETLLDMHSVAAVTDCHYDTFRKAWRRWVRDLGFPAPVRERPYAWRPSSLVAWQARREAETAAALRRTMTAPDAPANENTSEPARGRDRRVDHQRATLLSLMSGS